MPDDHARLGVFVPARQDIVAAFPGPGIDPAPLDAADGGFGWLQQDVELTPGRITPAAVLVPLVDHPGGMTVLLTQRTSHLKSHAGQVSFPGGKLEPHDPTPEDAALRETEEEIGLGRGSIEIIGRLNQRVTGTGFQVTPVVGLLESPLALRPDPGEVETVFEVPLEFVLDRRNHKIETRFARGVERQFYAMPYGEFYIWGLTARLLVALAVTLEAVQGPP